ncbi:dickkopf-related protein 3a isoform X2 [Brachyhypopomus gauderio]|uniref:dickkopf-related protein 3a isoform X2 n=1 Tax=Brachyhypopomus gauderio TaxID=698409 RepID=UPI004040F4D4
MSSCGILPETPTAVDVNFNASMEMNLSHEQTTVTDVFMEVKEQTEDAQHILQDAVHEMDSESAKSSRYVQNITANYYSESDSQTVAGNQSIPTAGTIDKVSDNTTEEVNIKTTDQSNGNENEIDHECITDENCAKGKYCLHEEHHSKCLPCKEQNTTCTKDEECCVGELCVWGQCAKNVTKGDAGTICQFQRDCNSDLCCAVHKALAFPVCSSKPIEHERCVLSANHLLELLSWDMEGGGPQEHCPCAADLQCQHLGRGSLCLKGQSSSEEELTDTLYSEIDYIV